MVFSWVWGYFSIETFKLVYSFREKRYKKGFYGFRSKISVKY